MTTATGPTSATAPPAHPRRWRRSLVRLSLVVGLFAVAYWKGRDDFQGFENSARDIQSQANRPRGRSDLVVVRITERDYAEMFGGRSPLDAARLRELLEAVAAGGPSVIGVDIDTSDSSHRALPAVGPTPVVWAQTASCQTDGGERPTGAECEGRPLAVDPVLGGAAGAPRSGLVMFQEDEGGTIRRYRRALATASGVRPMLSQAMLAAAGRPPHDDPRRSSDTAVRFIEFREWDPAWRSLRELDARTVVQLAAGDTAGAGYRSAAGPLRGKLVLVGGAYTAARDEYHTPLGMLPGVSIIAQTVATELEKADGGARPPGPLAVAAMQFVTSTVLLLVFLHFTLPSAFALSVVLIPALAFGASRAVSDSPFVAALHFFPLLVIVLIQQLFEAANDYRRELIAQAYASARAAGAAGPPREPARVSLGAYAPLVARAAGAQVSRARDGVRRWRERAVRRSIEADRTPPAESDGAARRERAE